MLFLSVYIFFFGAIFASFLNLCVYRIEKRESVKGIFVGRSFCESCKKELQWFELLPIFSFLFLLGRCSKCKEKISVFNLFSEILLGSFFVLFYFLNLPFVFFLFLLVLYFFAVYDFFYKSIPKNITDIITAISFVYWLSFLILDFDIHKLFPLAFFLLFGFFLFIFSRKKTLFGFGDILVLLILFFWLPPTLFYITLFCSFVLGAFFSIVLVFKDRKYWKKSLPFLPFVFLGFIIASFIFYLDLPLFDYILAMW